MTDVGITLDRLDHLVITVRDVDARLSTAATEATCRPTPTAIKKLIILNTSFFNCAVLHGALLDQEVAEVDQGLGIPGCQG